MNANIQDNYVYNPRHPVIRFFQIPEFQDYAAIVEFDRTVFACNPDLVAIFRRCPRAEYPHGWSERLCGATKQLLKLVLRTKSPDGVSLGYVRPLTEIPEQICANFQNDPALNEMIRKLRGGTYANN
jgi:hypothetical protein